MSLSETSQSLIGIYLMILLLFLELKNILCVHRSTIKVFSVISNDSPQLLGNPRLWPSNVLIQRHSSHDHLLSGIAHSIFVLLLVDLLNCIRSKLQEKLLVLIVFALPPPLLQTFPPILTSSPSPSTLYFWIKKESAGWTRLVAFGRSLCNAGRRFSEKYWTFPSWMWEEQFSTNKWRIWLPSALPVARHSVTHAHHVLPSMQPFRDNQ